MVERPQTPQTADELIQLYERIHEGEPVNPSERDRLRLAIERLLVGLPHWDGQQIVREPVYGVSWDLEQNGQVHSLEDVKKQLPIEQIKDMGFSPHTMFFLNKILDVVLLPVITDNFGSDESLRNESEAAFTFERQNKNAVNLLAVNILRVNTLRFLIDNTGMLSDEEFGFDVTEPGYVRAYGEENARYITRIMKRVHLGHGRVLYYLGGSYKNLASEQKLDLAATYKKTAALLLQLIVEPTNQQLRDKMEEHFEQAETKLLGYDFLVFNQSIELLGREVESQLIPVTSGDQWELLETDEDIEQFIQAHNLDEIVRRLETRKVALTNLKVTARLYRDSVSSIEANLTDYSKYFEEYLLAIQKEKEKMVELVTTSNQQLTDLRSRLEEAGLVRKKGADEQNLRIEQWKQKYPELGTLLFGVTNTQTTKKEIALES